MSVIQVNPLLLLYKRKGINRYLKVNQINFIVNIMQENDKLVS